MTKFDKSNFNSFIEDITNIKIQISYTGESYYGRPALLPDFMSQTGLEIIDYQATYTCKNESGEEVTFINYQFYPFSYVINDKYNVSHVNPFKPNNQFLQLIKDKTERVLEEINNNILLRVDKFLILDYLNNIYFIISELNNKIDTYNEERLFYGNTDIYRYSEVKREIIHGIENRWSYVDVNIALTPYWKSLKESFNKILRYIEIRIPIIKESNDYVKEITRIANPTYDFVWRKSDTDLLELITALVESNSITNSTYNLTRKDAIKLFSEIFNIEIKDPESKLSRATERKKDSSPFLTYLKQMFEDYCNRKDERQENLTR